MQFAFVVPFMVRVVYVRRRGALRQRRRGAVERDAADGGGEAG